MAISSSDVSLVPRKFLLEQSRSFDALMRRTRSMEVKGHQRPPNPRPPFLGFYKGMMGNGVSLCVVVDGVVADEQGGVERFR